MQDSTTTCGNCGKPVAASDVTCPHCDVLLAAYTSPEGSTSAHVYESSEPRPDTVPQAEMFVPDPAPPVVIPDKVEVASTAPRPLFDTQLTIEEISKAAEGEHEESLVVVSEKKVVTKPTVFETPDYAKPPSDAAPVKLVEGGNEELIARTHEDSRPQAPAAPTVKIPIPESPADPDTAPSAEARSEPRETKETPEDDESEPSGPGSSASVSPSYARPPDRPEVEKSRESGEGESWLYEYGTTEPEVASPKPKKKRTDKPKPLRTTTLPPGKRGTTEDYLRKLHEEAGYDSDKAQLSRPVGSKGSTGRSFRRRANSADQVLGSRPSKQLLESRQGCSGILYMTTGLVWLITLGTLMSGNASPFLIILAMVLAYAVSQKSKFFEFLEKQ